MASLVAVPGKSCSERCQRAVALPGVRSTRPSCRARRLTPPRPGHAILARWLRGLVDLAACRRNSRHRRDLPSRARSCLRTAKIAARQARRLRRCGNVLNVRTARASARTCRSPRPPSRWPRSDSAARGARRRSRFIINAAASKLRRRLGSLDTAGISPNIISSAAGPVIAHARGALFMVDIAVPRDISPGHQLSRTLSVLPDLARGGLAWPPTVGNYATMPKRAQALDQRLGRTCSGGDDMTNRHARRGAKSSKPRRCCSASTPRREQLDRSPRRWGALRFAGGVICSGCPG